MTNEDRQLVELITQQVLALLRQGDASRTASASSDPVPHTAPIHPPIGQCTGDYSKFPELAGKLYGNASPASLAVAAAAAKAVKSNTSIQPDGGDIINTNLRAPSPMASTPGARAVGVTPGIDASPFEPLPLTGIITANQLQEAIKASPDGTVLLAADARLTPLANDFARQKKNKIHRASASGAGHAASSSTPSHSTSVAKPAHSVGGSSPVNQWLWWIEGGCPIVRDVTQSFGLTLRPIAAGPTGGALPQVVRELARAVKARQASGGILFVPSASKAVCMANRCQSLRAIVGTCGEAVEQGLREIGANVLIIEYPHHGHRSTIAMLERFTQQLPVIPASVERMLVDMQRQ